MPNRCWDNHWCYIVCSYLEHVFKSSCQTICLFIHTLSFLCLYSWFVCSCGYVLRYWWEIGMVVLKSEPEVICIISFLCLPELALTFSLSQFTPGASRVGGFVWNVAQPVKCNSTANPPCLSPPICAHVYANLILSLVSKGKYKNKLEKKKLNAWSPM